MKKAYNGYFAGRDYGSFRAGGMQQPAGGHGQDTENSHFMFQELNNDVIADHIEAWLKEKGLG